MADLSGETKGETKVFKAPDPSRFLTEDLKDCLLRYTQFYHKARRSDSSRHAVADPAVRQAALSAAQPSSRSTRRRRRRPRPPTGAGPGPVSQPPASRRPPGPGGAAWAWYASLPASRRCEILTTTDALWVRSLKDMIALLHANPDSRFFLTDPPQTTARGGGGAGSFEALPNPFGGGGGGGMDGSTVYTCRRSKTLPDGTVLDYPELPSEAAASEALVSCARFLVLEGGSSGAGQALPV